MPPMNDAGSKNCRIRNLERLEFPITCKIRGAWLVFYLAGSSFIIILGFIGVSWGLSHMHQQSLILNVVQIVFGPILSLLGLYSLIWALTWRFVIDRHSVRDQGVLHTKHLSQDAILGKRINKNTGWVSYGWRRECGGNGLTGASPAW